MQPLIGLSPTRPRDSLPTQAIALAAPPREEPATSPGLPNPRLRLDPRLGLVVLEFRDGQGRVERTLPTERELAAYRSAATAAKDAAAQDGAAREPGQA